MDVVLINPCDENAVKNCLGFKVPPLNLMYLAASLEKALMSVKILDDDIMQMGEEKVTQLVSKMDPMIVGLTASTSNIKKALKYVEKIKKTLPNTLTMIGGPHTTFIPFETLQENEFLDLVVVGEGEKTVVELAQNYSKYGVKGLENVRGIVYRTPDRNAIKIKEPQPLIKDLDSIPFPARHLVPFHAYGVSKDQEGDMITSRGCVYSCEYCSSSLIMGKKFRSRSPENVVDEVEELTNEYKIKNIAFLDDTFMMNKRRAGEIADEIKSRGLDVSYVASSRVDMVNKDLLAKLKDSGMNTLYYGVESGSQRVLDLMKKRITLKQAEYAVESAKDAGIRVLTSFILGFPGETADEIDKTIDFSIKLNADYSQYSILTPFPGTPIYHELKDKKLLDTENWDKYTVLKSVIKYENIGLSKKFVERKLAKAYLKFYTRPKYLLEHKYMFKVMVETIFRSFILPKLNGGTSEGWYQEINKQMP
ncbi:B12-binding domain-containing radical SAM protein [Methanobacterium aggregans]|uniref:B12-binding domain-containing radical SAM protein n=1 Tax=Methanobacterium aggregans TaxID=1615586 RepID=UPI0032112BDB